MMTDGTITLRSIEDKDLATVQAWNFDENIAKHFSPRLPISRNEQVKWFEGQINSSTKKKLIIEHNATGEIIGMVGIMNIDHVNKNCEVGLTIGNHKFSRTGLAGSALALTIDFLFFQMNLHMVYLNVLEKNNAAVSFFEKFGFVKKGVLQDILFKDNEYQSYLWMNLLKSNYKKK